MQHFQNLSQSNVTIFENVARLLHEMLQKMQCRISPALHGSIIQEFQAFVCTAHSWGSAIPDGSMRLFRVKDLLAVPLAGRYNRSKRLAGGPNPLG